MTAKEHNKIIGILHLVEGGLQIFGVIILGLGIFGAGIYFQSIENFEKSETIVKVLIIGAIVLTVLSFLLAFVNLIAGWKILKEKSGARMWGIVASFVCLLNVPLGTIIGVYSLWFLFGVEGKSMYSGNSANSENPIV